MSAPRVDAPEPDAAEADAPAVRTTPCGTVGGLFPARAPNRPARLNRLLLGLLGLVLLAGGLLVLLIGTGTVTGLGPLALLGADTPLIPPGRGLQPWVGWVVIVVGVLVGLLCLRWLGAQTARRPPTPVWRMSEDPAGGLTFLDAEVAARAVARDVGEHTGVVRAKAVLVGERLEPTLHLTVLAHHDAPLEQLRRHVDEYAVPRLCQALELDAMPTDLLIRLADRPLPTAARLS